MAGKKAKSAARASKTNKSKTGAKTAKKGSPLGSLKKMLGLGAKATKAKGVGKASASKPGPGAVRGKGTPPAVVVSKAVAGKGAKPAAKPVLGKCVAKGSIPAQVAGRGAKGAKPAPAAPVGKAGKAAKGAGAAKTSTHVSGGAPVCREVACELMSTTGGYCRMHYIKNWKKIKRKEMILKERKLNSYIEELVSKYPDKYIEAIRQDLASEKDFAKVIADLEIEEGLDDFESVETETAEGIIDNIKRDFEDEGDAF